MAPLSVVWPPPSSASPASNTDRTSLYVPSVGHAARAAASHAPSAARPQNPRSRSSNSAGFRFNLAANMSQTATHETGSLRRQDSVSLNTLPDPRSGSPLSMASRTPSNDSQHGLNDEVAALSVKLVNAINHQTRLDDQLQSSRHELDQAKKRIATLEGELKEHRHMVDTGLLVQRSTSERAEQALKQQLEEENKKRADAEKDKKGMEQELENLTTQLFEEANKMVANARQEREAAEKRTEQVKAKLEETEALLANHQEQLRDLKHVMQQLQSAPSESHQGSAITTPSTPAVATFERARSSDVIVTQRSAEPTQVPFPDSPLSYSHLIQPVVRTDLSTYEEFLSLMKVGQQQPSSRVTSGSSFGGLNLMGLGGRETPQPTVTSSQPNAPSDSSAAPSQAPSPNIPASAGDPPSPTTAGANLKDTKFYKRVLAEDIEPTLRLDLAPGLSWLARRSVISAMLCGGLIVEPFPANSRFYSTAFSCSLCGEARNEYDYIRRHRFKTSDSEDAQRYPLCDYCLARVRAVCDFMGFMRLVRKGHYRSETLADCKIAWDESIRLRERLFWTRLGGGVVPASTASVGPQSPTFTEAATEESRASLEQRSSIDAIRLGRTLGGRGKRLSEIQSSAAGAKASRPQSVPDAVSLKTTTPQPKRSSVAEDAFQRPASPLADDIPELSPRRSRPSSLSPTRRAAVENSIIAASEMQASAITTPLAEAGVDSPALVVSRDTTPVPVDARRPSSPTTSARHLSPARPSTAKSTASTTSVSSRKSNKVTNLASRFQTDGSSSRSVSPRRSSSNTRSSSRTRQKVQIPGLFG